MATGLGDFEVRFPLFSKARTSVDWVARNGTVRFRRSKNQRLEQVTACVEAADEDVACQRALELVWPAMNYLAYRFQKPVTFEEHSNQPLKLSPPSSSVRLAGDETVHVTVDLAGAIVGDSWAEAHLSKDGDVPEPDPVSAIPKVPKNVANGLEFYHYALLAAHVFERVSNFYKSCGAVLGDNPKTYLQQIASLGVREVQGAPITEAALKRFQEEVRVPLAHGELQDTALPLSREDIGRFERELPLMRDLARQIIGRTLELLEA